MGQGTCGQKAAAHQASIRDTLQLASLPGLGPRTLASLFGRFESAAAVLQASASELADVPGVGPKMVHMIRTASDYVSVDEILSWCEQHNTHIVLRDDANYPRRLQDLEDAPSVLYVKGELQGTDALSVAIVGTRHPTAYGRRQAQRLGHELAQAGVTIVSGLARGVDSEAHQGALEGGGRTIAILGGGLGQMYPPENETLAERCSQSGAVLSEQAPFTKPRSGLFPQRNRLIAGMSLATLVVEAPDRSGSLITARFAGEQNRDVLALPGPVTSRASRGCHQLIRDGATLVQTVDDILESIGPMQVPVQTDSAIEIRHPAELQLNEIERAVLQSIAPESTSIDAVIATSGLPAHRVFSTISVLEMRRLIRRLSGQYVSRI